MASWADVDAAVSALPESGAGRMYQDWRVWRVRDKSIAWERPLGARDAPAAPDADGAILAVRVADTEAKMLLIADDPDLYFTIPHFDGFPAVLVRLDRIPVDELRGLLADAWRIRATRTLRKQHPEL